MCRELRDAGPVKTRNLLILAGVTALLIVVAATVQLTSGNLFGTSGALKQTDVVETTIAAPADTSVAPGQP